MGAPEGGHPFLDHSWCVSNSDQGIAWGVLATPRMKDLHGVGRGQGVEEDIRYPQYLIKATSEGALRLHQEPKKPLPLPQLIFLHTNNNILTWLPANHGQDPLDQMVVESRHENGEDEAQTPEPANGRYPFLNRKVWEDTVEAMQADEDEDTDEDEDEDEDEEWLEAEKEGEGQALPAGGTIVLDSVSTDT